MSPGRPRPLVLGLILGAHIILFHILERSVLTTSPQSTPDDTPFIALTFTEIPSPVRAPSQIPTFRPRLPQRLNTPKAIPPDVPTPSLDENSITPSLTDWSTEAHLAASDTLERERQKVAKHSFAHPTTAPDTPHQAGAFGSSQENHRAGQVEEGQRFWVTDNCYFDIPRGTPPPRMAGEFHLLTRTCKPPPTGGGDRMFEHLKPDSAKQLPRTGDMSRAAPN